MTSDNERAIEAENKRLCDRNKELRDQVDQIGTCLFQVQNAAIDLAKQLECALQRDDRVVKEMAKHAEGLLEFVINKYNVKDADGFTCPHHRALYIALSKFNASRGKS